MRWLLQILIHFISQIIIQIMLWSIMIWYYDVGVKDYLLCMIITIGVLCFDYYCSRKIGCYDHAFYHFADIVFAVPSMIMSIREIWLYIDLQTLPTVILVITVNTIIILERIILARNKS